MSEKVTFESLLTDVDFMKSVFAALEGVRQTPNLTDYDRHEAEKNVVGAIYGTHGITLTEDNFAAIKSYCKEAEKAVSNLTDEEAKMLNAGAEALGKMSPMEKSNLAENLIAAGNMLKNGNI